MGTQLKHNTGSYRFVNGKVITCAAEVGLEDWCVQTGSDGTISYVGPEQGAPAIVDGEVDIIDLNGKTIMPGLIDTHMHLGSTGDGMDGWVFYPRSYRFYKLINILRTLLDAGFTTVRDMGGVDTGIRRAIDDGLISGPRLQVAISLLTHTGGHADGVSIAGVDTFPSMFLMPPEMPVGCIVDSDDEVIKGVRKVVRYGANFIKVSATGGPGAMGGQADVPGLTEHQIRLVVDEARRLKITRVVAHAMGHEGIRNAVNAGVSSIEHGWEMSEELAELMIKNSTWMVPTLSGAHKFSTMDASEDQKNNPGLGLAHWGRVGIEGARVAINAGVPIAFGTDLGGAGAGTNGLEFGHLVDLGLSPEKAILAATKNAASLLDIESEVGTVEVGKKADLVVVDGNPIADISLLGDPNRIHYVIKNGVIEKNIDG